MTVCLCVMAIYRAGHPERIMMAFCVSLHVSTLKISTGRRLRWTETEIGITVENDQLCRNNNQLQKLHSHLHYYCIQCQLTNPSKSLIIYVIYIIIFFVKILSDLTF